MLLLFVHDDARRQYELREKASRDYQSNINAARDEGMQQGLQQGTVEERTRLVRKMLAAGLDEGLIKRTADLTEAELNKIKKI